MAGRVGPTLNTSPASVRAGSISARRVSALTAARGWGLATLRLRRWYLLDQGLGSPLARKAAASAYTAMRLLLLTVVWARA